jgi:hypothetical protein
VSGFSWQPQTDQRDLFISYELRPGADRPGPPKLWEEFDRAVERLGIAAEPGVDALPVLPVLAVS